jgi:hypothetical protein
VIHQQQCLRGNVGLWPASHNSIWVGKVEGDHQFGQLISNDGQIDASSQRFLGIERCLGSTVVIHQFPKPTDRRIGQSQVDRSSDAQHGITKLFGCEPFAMRSPKQPILWVKAFCGLVRRNLHLVGVAQHDSPYNVLDRPIVLDEIRSQRIQQLRVGGGIA